MADRTIKRSACQRCRRQKLRCVRPSFNRSCERCQKAKTMCCTSESSRPEDNSTDSVNSGTQSIYASSNSTGSGPQSEAEFAAPNNNYLDGNPFDFLISEFGDFTPCSMDSELLGKTVQDQCQYSNDISSHSNTTSGDIMETWEETDLGSLFNHTPPASISVADIPLEEPSHAPTVSSHKEPLRNSSEPGLQAKHGSQKDKEPLCRANNSLPQSPSGQTLAGVTMPQCTGYPSQQAHRLSAGSLSVSSSNDIKCYTTQILNLNRQLTRRADEYAARRRCTLDPSLDTELADSSPIASRHFMEVLFSHSQAFLAVLQRIQSWAASSASPSRRPAESQPENASTSWCRGSTAPSTSTRSALCTMDNKIARPHQVLNFQTLLAIISGYAHTIEAFDHVFQELLSTINGETARDDLSTVNGETACADLSAALSEFMPEVSIGNVQLGIQPQTHVKYLLHFSSTVLESIENILGIAPSCVPNTATTGTSGDGLLGSAQSQGLLDALFDQKDLTYGKADGTRAARVKHTIDQIHWAINSARG